ncbi:MAG: hypothetical protein IJ223_06225 [Clostridia bacterium]|nr:hypothetical protein [Clostridia bacterium]
MKNEKVQELIEMINNMETKDKLRLGVCMSSSSYTKLKYNKAHIHSIFDNKLKKIDNEYLVSYINMRKYPILTFAMAKIMEMTEQEQNQVALYLVNALCNTNETKK